MSMQWFKAHLYTMGLFGAAVLLVFVAIVVYRTVPASLGSEGGVWGASEGGLFDATSYAPNIAGEIVPVQQTLSGDAAAPSIALTAETYVSRETRETEISELLAQLSSALPSSSGKETDLSSVGEFAYSFIPQGLISTSTVVEISAEDKALYEYGNTIGIYITAFESRSGASTNVLKDHAEDLGDSAKSSALERLGSDMRGVGETLLLIEDVPEGAASAHTELATSYQNAGEALIAVSKVQGATEFLSAIETYNAAADTLLRSYVALSLIFSINQIGFTESDAGSVFMFKSSGL